MEELYLETGVIAKIGESIKENPITNIAHTIDLFIQYGNNPIEPIQIQIDAERMEKKDKDNKTSSDEDYIRLLYDIETAHNAQIYDLNKKKITF